MALQYCTLHYVNMHYIWALPYTCMLHSMLKWATSRVYCTMSYLYTNVYTVTCKNYTNMQSTVVNKVVGSTYMYMCRWIHATISPRCTSRGSGWLWVVVAQQLTSLCLQNWMMSMSALVQVAAINGALVQVAAIISALVQFGCYHWCSSTGGCYHQCSSTVGCYHS